MTDKEQARKVLLENAAIAKDRIKTDRSGYIAQLTSLLAAGMVDPDSIRLIQSEIIYLQKLLDFLRFFISTDTNPVKLENTFRFITNTDGGPVNQH